MYERALLPAALAAFFLLAFVLPALRLRRSHGISGVTFHRTRAPAQRLVGAAMANLLLGVAGFAAGYAALGPAAVGAPPPSPPRSLAGAALVALGIAVVVVAQAQMRGAWRIGIDDRPTALVTVGLYRHVRNPIYAGMFVALAGVAVVAPAPAFVALGLAAVGVVSVQTRLEERHLLALHGDAYRAWASRVGRFIPAVGRLR